MTPEYIYARFWLALYKSVVHVFSGHNCDSHSIESDEFHECSLVRPGLGEEFYVCSRSGLVHSCSAISSHPFKSTTREEELCTISKRVLGQATESGDWQTRDVVDYANGNESLDANKQAWAKKKYNRLFAVAADESKAAAARAKAKAKKADVSGKNLSVKNQESRRILGTIGFNPANLTGVTEPRLNTSGSVPLSLSSSSSITNLIASVSSGAYLGGEDKSMRETPRLYWCTGNSFCKTGPVTRFSTKMIYCFHQEKMVLSRSKSADCYLADYFWETLLLHNVTNSEKTGNELVRKYQEAQDKFAASFNETLKLCNEFGFLPKKVAGQRSNADTHGKSNLEKSQDYILKTELADLKKTQGLCTVVSSHQEITELIRRDMVSFKALYAPPNDWFSMLQVKYGRAKCAGAFRILLLLAMHGKWLKQTKSNGDNIRIKLNEFVKTGYQSPISASLLQHAVEFFGNNLVFVDQLFPVLINSAIASGASMVPHPLWLHEFALTTKRILTTK
tara:strand:- start:1146 stop:2663 length:1518 start_codon:yes stop_codon:yes gene_type:complete